MSPEAVRAPPPNKRDLRLVHGEATRRRILDAAMDVASTEGFEALTIGRLATDLGMSKAGLFGHFGSKEALQLATLESARLVFIDQVVREAINAPEGLPRLVALCDAWMAYVERRTFRGGCIFAGAAAEFDDRPGAVRDRVAEIVCEWVQGLEMVVRDAQRLGHVRAAVDPCQVAFELNAFQLGGNWGHQLFADGVALRRARTAIERLIADLRPKAKRSRA